MRLPDGPSVRLVENEKKTTKRPLGEIAGEADELLPATPAVLLLISSVVSATRSRTKTSSSVPAFEPSIDTGVSTANAT
jgi:hypothetical protein